MLVLPYTLEEHETTIAVERYIAEYTDVEACRSACRACERYGKNWACPPFDFDPVEFLRRYEVMDVICDKAVIDRSAASGIPVEEYPACTRQSFALIKLVVEDKLLARERRAPGSLALTPGSCMRCPQGCKRAEGLPCISPGTLRTTLEALGGTLGPLVKDLFGLEFSWTSPDELPEYFLLVSAVLHPARES